MNRVASQGQSIGTLSECFKNKSCLRLKWADKKINGCLPSNWTRLSCTRINHASIFWSMGRTWFNSRKTKLCGHGEGNTPALVKKKRYFVLLTFQTTLSLGTRLSKKAVISQTKRDITLKDTHEAQVDSDDSEECEPWETFPPLRPQLRSDCLQPVTSSPADSLTRAHSKTSLHTNTHTRQTSSECLTGQSRARACFDAKLSGNSVFPPLLFIFFLFPPSNCLVYFSRLTKSFSTAVTDVLDRTRVGLRDSLASTEKRINRFLKDL